MDTVSDYTAFRDPLGFADRLFQDCIKILEHCPNIAGIGVPHDANYSTLLFFSTAVQERLRSVNLRPTCLSCDVLAPSELYTLLCLWPSVRYVTANFEFYELQSLPPHLPGLLRGVRLAYNVEPEELAWILSCQTDEPPLHEVEISSLSWSQRPSIDAMFAGPASHHIRSLTTPVMPPSSVLERLPHLEELIFSVLPKTRPTLPRNICHIGYHDANDVEVYWLTAALADLPLLQLVTGTRSSPSAVLGILEKTCRSLDVEFIVHEDGESFPSQECRLDLVCTFLSLA